MLLPLWNVWYFFSLYANAAGEQGYEAARRTDSADVLDRVPARQDARPRRRASRRSWTSSTSPARAPSVARVPRRADELVRAPLARPVLGPGGVPTTPGRRSTRSSRCSRCCAGSRRRSLPLVTEEIWRGLTGGRSVHLTDWPLGDELPADDALVAAMDAVREVASATLGLRKAQALRVRLPLRLAHRGAARPGGARAVRRRPRRRGERQGGAPGRARTTPRPTRSASPSG